MLVQIAPSDARPRNPENPIQNKPVVPRATAAPGPALDHKRLKAGPFLVAHQTAYQNGLRKSHVESESEAVGNPLCQHVLGEIIAALLGRPAAEARFSFACPPPPHAQRMRAALNGRVGYDAAVNTVTIPIDWEDIPSPFADPILFAQTSAALQVALQRLTAPVTIRGRVETLLAAMPDGRLGSAAAAKRLGISQRTMVRRLGEAGTTYRALLDDEIRQRASRLLATGGLSHSEIAVQLGYEDATSFSRAYRRWFNQ